MKPFNAKEVKAGKQVRTRDGRSVRIICYDIKGSRPIIACVNNLAGGEEINSYPCSGRWITRSTESPNDLFMKSEGPNLDDYKTIRSYEDACKALGEKPIPYAIEPPCREISHSVPNHIVALMQLETIGRALRNNDIRCKYAPAFTAGDNGDVLFEQIITTTSDDIVSNNEKWYLMPSAKIARYYGRQFVDLWSEYLMGE